jgi:hypothetical protein
LKTVVEFMKKPRQYIQNVGLERSGTGLLRMKYGLIQSAPKTIYRSKNRFHKLIHYFGNWECESICVNGITHHFFGNNKNTLLHVEDRAPVETDLSAT